MTFLADNARDSSYIYLVSVLTGMNQRSGTNATITMRLYGDKGKSDKHLLKDSNQRLFKTGSEDWFVLTETSSLGNLKSIVLSIDYTNTNHYWYVKNTIYYNILYTFWYAYFKF